MCIDCDITICVLIVKAVFFFSSQHISLELNPNTSLKNLLLLKTLLDKKRTLLNCLLNYNSDNLLNILSKYIYLYYLKNMCSKHMFDKKNEVSIWVDHTTGKLRVW
jgi:hypothetical protein